MAKEKKPTVAEEVAVEEEKKDSEKERIEKFIARKLVACNLMENEAKARANASRILSNRKGYK